jgi:alpha-aminoadipate carrier protein LysW
MATTQIHTFPECEDEVQISDSVRLNEIVECAGCRNELEFTALSPAVLALAPQVEEQPTSSTSTSATRHGTAAEKRYCGVGDGHGAATPHSPRTSKPPGAIGLSPLPSRSQS